VSSHACNGLNGTHSQAGVPAAAAGSGFLPPSTSSSNLGASLAAPVVAAAAAAAAAGAQGSSAAELVLAALQLQQQAAQAGLPGAAAAPSNGLLHGGLVNGMAGVDSGSMDLLAALQHNPVLGLGPPAAAAGGGGYGAAHVAPPAQQSGLHLPGLFGGLGAAGLLPGLEQLQAQPHLH
jgi:hypothetical protein